MLDWPGAPKGVPGPFCISVRGMTVIGSKRRQLRRDTQCSLPLYFSPAVAAYPVVRSINRTDRLRPRATSSPAVHLAASVIWLNSRQVLALQLSFVLACDSLAQVDYLQGGYCCRGMVWLAFVLGCGFGGFEGFAWGGVRSPGAARGGFSLFGFRANSTANSINRA
jgi:hypothetical protein